MSEQNSKEKRINENELLEEESLEAVAEAIEKTFRKRNNEIDKHFNERADEIEEEFITEADKIEKKYVKQFIILILCMILASVCGAWFAKWFSTDGFTDYYRPFDEIKSIVAEAIEEPFSLSIVFTNTSEANVTLDFEGEANDTSFVLENVKWDLNGKKLYIKESVAESLVEKYEANRNKQ